MRYFATTALCSLLSIGLFAAHNDAATGNGTSEAATADSNSTLITDGTGVSIANDSSTLITDDAGVSVSDSISGGVADSATIQEKKRYTFGDFFDALDLPTVLGVGVTPNGIEGATFNSSMRLGWRHHKSYGVFVFISYDTHSNTYESLSVGGTNVRSGEVWYNEIGMGLGYRIPLVKDIRTFYEKPYFNHWDFFVSIEPGVSIPKVKNVVPYDNSNLGTSGLGDGSGLSASGSSEGNSLSASGSSEENNLSTSGSSEGNNLSTSGSSKGNSLTYQLQDQLSAVPTLRFAAGVEWFIVHNFGVFAEVAYIQHLTPTVIEQAAIEQGLIKAPSGPIVVSIGLSLFFN